MNKFAIDTNILVYSHSQDAEKKQNIARNLIIESPVVSTQVVSEYVNVLKRIMKIPKQQIFGVCLPNLKRCNIFKVDAETLQYADYLIQRYDFQLFDAIIVAAALEASCQILYSEDMQHNMKIERQLTIINPFL
jgi:predicted nucleic acid-binding protein